VIGADPAQANVDGKTGCDCIGLRLRHQGRRAMLLALRVH
jgi:hypothetical protein